MSGYSFVDLREGVQRNVLPYLPVISEPAVNTLYTSSVRFQKFR